MIIVQWYQVKTFNGVTKKYPKKFIKKVFSNLIELKAFRNSKRIQYKSKYIPAEGFVKGYWTKDVFFGYTEIN